MASCFIGFAIGKVVSVLIAGPIIDKFGAIRLLPYHPVPMGLGLLALAVSDHPGVALFYLAASMALSAVLTLRQSRPATGD